MIEAIVRDIRFALRRLRKSPGFALIAVASLALGIGANTAIFSLVDAIILRKAPIPQPQRVVDVSTSTQDYAYFPFSYPEYTELRQATQGVFARISYTQFGMVPRDLADRAATLPVEMVNGDYFPLLGLRPRLGRLLGPDDDAAEGASPVVVLSYDYWQDSFGGASDVVGKQIRLSGRLYTIVGVAPQSYTGTIRGMMPMLYASIQMTNALQPSPYDELKARDDHDGFVKARLAPAVGMARARVAAASFERMEQKDHPSFWPASRRIDLVPLSSVAVNPLIDRVVVPAAALIMVLVGLVLLIACANLASFLLAQARDRQREIAIRLALGAGRGAIVRQLLTETLALAGLGGVAGVLLARFLLDWLLHADLPFPLPFHLDVPMDGRIVAFAIAASAVSGVLFGLAPALQATRPGVIDAIKNENTGGGPARWLTVRNALVVGQVAVSLVLLIAAGLFLRSLLAWQSADPGWGSRPTAMVTLMIPADRYPAARGLAFADRLRDELRVLPGVGAVGYASQIPLDPMSSGQRMITVPGREPPRGETGFSIFDAEVDSGYLAVAGIPVLRGRGFGAGDVAGAPRVAVITQAMARRFWPGQDPVGRVFRMDTSAVHVIGVTRDVKVRTLGEAPQPYMFLAAAQESVGSLTFLVSTRGDAAPLVGRALATVHDADRDVPIFRAMTVRRFLASLILPAQLAALVIGAFALLALVLAVIGIWGVVRYAVSRRTREVAIRMSMGAKPAGVILLLMRHGVGLVGVGAVLGLLLGLAGATVLRSFLFGVSAFDPLTFVAVPLLLMAVGVAASYLPARRASRLDPARVLRAE